MNGHPVYRAVPYLRLELLEGWLSSSPPPTTFCAATETSLASFSWMKAILSSISVEMFLRRFLNVAEAEERLSEIPVGRPRKAST